MPHVFDPLLVGVLDEIQRHYGAPLKKDMLSCTMRPRVRKLQWQENLKCWTSVLGGSFKLQIA